MNPFDMLVAVILGYCLIRGIFRGFIKELSSIIGVLGGFYAAYTYYYEFAELISKFISDEIPYLNIVSFMIIFCGIFMAISLLGVLIKYLLSVSHFGWIDRTLGAATGFIKGILIVSVILIALTAFLPKKSSIIKTSKLSPYITLVAENMAKVVSDDMKKEFAGNLTEFKKVWKSR